MAQRLYGMERAACLADALFCLAEPWRGHFLAFLAQRATRWTWDGRLPTQQEVARWLADGQLYEVVVAMLVKWQGPQIHSSEAPPIH